MSDNSDKYSPDFWAKKFCELLSPEEFGDFAEFLDGCNDVDFYIAVADIDCELNPHLYVTPDLPELNAVLPTDYEECATCHFDHTYNPSDAAAVHDKLAEQDIDHPEK